VPSNEIPAMEYKDKKHVQPPLRTENATEDALVAIQTRAPRRISRFFTTSAVSDVIEGHRVRMTNPYSKFDRQYFVMHQSIAKNTTVFLVDAPWSCATCHNHQCHSAGLSLDQVTRILLRHGTILCTKLRGNDRHNIIHCLRR
jgi:hypothetical protein